MQLPGASSASTTPGLAALAISEAVAEGASAERVLRAVRRASLPVARRTLALAVYLLETAKDYDLAVGSDSSGISRRNSAITATSQALEALTSISFPVILELPRGVSLRRHVD